MDWFKLNNLNQYINKNCKSSPINLESEFSFTCSKKCWDTCCLKQNVGMLQLSVHDVYKLLSARKDKSLLDLVEVKIDEETNLPKAFIKWMPDEKCPNLNDDGGCMVYEDRPFPCRVFPLESRIYINDENKEAKIQYMLRENICFGFMKEAEPEKQTLEKFIMSEDFEDYEKYEKEEALFRDGLRTSYDLKNISKEKIHLLAQAMYCLGEKIHQRNKQFMDILSEQLNIPKRIKRIESFTSSELTELSLREFGPRMAKKIFK